MRGLLLALLLLPSPASAFFLGKESKVFRDMQASFEKGRYEEVVTRLKGEGMLKVPRRDRGRAYRLLAASYQSQGRTQDAIAVFRLAEGLYPKNLEVLSGLADLLHANGLDEQARPFYERVLAIHPNNAASNLGMGEIFKAKGFTLRAQTYYERALKDWDSDPRIWRGYAEVLARRRDFAAAIKAVSRALELSEDGDSLRMLALFQRELRDADAYSTLTRALAKSGDPETLLRRALWLLEDDRLDEALADAGAVLKESPEQPLALWIRASANLRRGRDAEARRDLQAAARAERTAPFVARTAAAMLERLGGR